MLPPFRLLALVVLAVLVGAVPAQNPAPGQNPGPAAAGRRLLQDPVQRAALQALAEDLEAQRQALRQAREAVTTAADKAHAVQEVRDLEQVVRDLEWRFDSLVVGIDTRDFDVPKSAAEDLQSELGRLLQPLVQKLKDITAEPREIEELAARIDTLEKDRLPVARRALQRVQAELDALDPANAENARLRSHLEQVRSGWEGRQRTMQQQLAVLRGEHRNRLDTRTSFWRAATEETRDFFRNRGLNLLLAVLAFLGVYTGLRFVQRRLSLTRRPRDERGFLARVAEVLLNLLVVGAAVGATLITLYVAGDWLLLALALIFLLGVGWTAIRMLPQYFEQVRLMLNLGAVREGERIVIDGLPWRVDALKFYSVLTNPELQGGVLRMPLRDLIGQRSRPMHPDEPWFPCRVGDVVLLADGVRGKVKLQTPEHVVMSHFQAERSYATAAFLEQSPRNLSRGFLVDVVFGVDYQHQAEATETIPRAFREAVQAELPKTVEPRHIVKVDAEFREAGASSLDVLVLVEMKGDAAADSLKIQRLVRRILTDTCTRNGWVIPFQQITVHQASA